MPYEKQIDEMKKQFGEKKDFNRYMGWDVGDKGDLRKTVDLGGKQAVFYLPKKGDDVMFEFDGFSNSVRIVTEESSHTKLAKTQATIDRMVLTGGPYNADRVTDEIRETISRSYTRTPLITKEEKETPGVVGFTDVPLEKMVDNRKQGTDTKNSEHKITYLNGIEFNEWALTLGGSEKRYFLEAFADKIARGKHEIPEYRTIEFDRPFSLEKAVESVYQGQLVQDIKRDLQMQNSRKTESETAEVVGLPDGTKAYKEMHIMQIDMGICKHSALGYDESLKTKLADHDVHNYEEGRINALVTFGKFDYYNPQTKSKTYVLEVRGLEGNPNATEVFQFSKHLDHMEGYIAMPNVLKKVGFTRPCMRARSFGDTFPTKLTLPGHP